MNFYELIDEKTDEKLDANEEYVKLATLYNKLSDLYNTARKLEGEDEEGRSMNNWLDAKDFVNMRKYMELWPEEKKKLEVKMESTKNKKAKAKLMKKINAGELQYVDDEIRINAEEDFQKLMEESGENFRTLEEKMADIKRAAVREVLRENIDNELIKNECCKWFGKVERGECKINSTVFSSDDGGARWGKYSYYAVNMIKDKAVEVISNKKYEAEFNILKNNLINEKK